MDKRKWNKLGIETSLLGYGCMRLPTKQDGTVDEERSFQLFDQALAGGVNYYDTAYMYCNFESERILGRWMKQKRAEGKGDLFHYADKLPSPSIQTLEQAQKIFYEQLEKLQVDHFDFYLMHCFNKNNYYRMRDLGVIDWVAAQKKAGKVRYLGFSFHDDYALFEEILTSRDWDFCQIQYNYMDNNIQAGDKGYQLCVERGVPVIVMEPVKGGSLAALSDKVAEPFRKVDSSASMASWAMRWVADHSNVHIILSGMNSEQQVADNIATLSGLKPLSEEERSAIEAVRENILHSQRNGCTGCEYCQPCPQQVKIPEIFELWNEYGMYNNKIGTKSKWSRMAAENRADMCVDCGLCESKCPQHLPIRDDLKKAQKELEAIEMC